MSKDDSVVLPAKQSLGDPHINANVVSTLLAVRYDASLSPAVS